MDNNFEQFQKIVGASDEFAETDLITELDVYVKYVPRGGKGFVNLNKPDDFPEVFCPETQQYCIITVLEHNGYKLKEGVTIHTIINELKLVNGFVPVTKIKHILEKKYHLLFN
jgi:hypothetical protein